MADRRSVLPSLCSRKTSCVAALLMGLALLATAGGAAAQDVEAPAATAADTSIAPGGLPRGCSRPDLPDEFQRVCDRICPTTKGGALH